MRKCGCQLRLIAVFLICLQLMPCSGVAAADKTQDSAGARLIAGGRFDIRVTLGFSERFRLKRWTPLSVSIGNRGVDLIGQLAVETAGGNELLGEHFTSSHRQDIELSSGARKKFYFTVFLDNPARPLQVRIIENGRELARRTIDLRNRFSTGDLVLVLSRDADLDYLNDSSGEALRVLYPHPSTLPEHWLGYDGIAAIVLHGVSLEQLNAKQFEALQRWQASGGVLVISGGPDYALLRTPRLAELVPGTPVAIAQITEKAVLSGSLPAIADLPRPFAVNRLTRFRGNVLYRADEWPLIIEQDRGRGRILYLTFDVARAPFANWAGMKRLWLQSLRLVPLQPTAFKESEALSPIPAIIRREAKSFPQHATVFVFLALYLGLLLTGYRLTSGRDHKRSMFFWLAWVSPLLFAPLAYLLFGPLFFPQGASALMLATIEPLPHSPYAYLQVDLGIYSRRKTNLLFDYAGAEPVFYPTRWDMSRVTKPAQNWIFYDNPRRSLKPERGREYVLYLLAGRDIVAYDLSGSVEKTRAGLQLHLRNDSGRMLHNAWFIFGENIYPLGSIADDSDVSRSFAADSDTGKQRQGPVSLTNAIKAGMRDQRITENQLDVVLDAIHEKQKRDQNSAFFIGFSSNPLRLSGTVAAWPGNELALVLMRFSVDDMVSGQEEIKSVSPNARAPAASSGVLVNE